MAVINYSEERVNNGVRKLVWSNLANGDSGQWYQLTGASYPDKCVQVFGTFGTGGTLTIEGSNESGTVNNYATLSDIWGVALSFTGAGIRQVCQNPLSIRPRVTAGDTNTSLTVILVLKR